MYRELLIRIESGITTAALLEDRRLVNINFEHSAGESLMGNIYKGRVENVLPGMQAAFVDIGLEKNSFLYIDDALPKVSAEEGESPPPRKQSIRDVLKKGQEVLVQVFKEPVGGKGARVTTHPTLPGRLAVLMPTARHVAVSRRIGDERERQRLKALAAASLPPGMGAIIRTEANGAEKEVLAAELKYLVKLWKRVLGKGAKAKAPALIHRDLDLLQRVLRDTVSEDIDQILLESAESLDKVTEVMELTSSALKSKVFVSAVPDLFALYDVDKQIARAMNRKVWMKSGGYLVIDHTEALTAIDVNTGKYVGEADLEETVLHINLEAVTEIGRQLRLRNIGGIIVVDFIDMELAQHKALVLSALEAEMKKDRVKVTVLGMTQLGLVEMTRKKIGQEMTGVMEKECPFCRGKGRVLTEESAATNLKKELQRLAAESEAPVILAEAHPLTAACLIGRAGQNLALLERQTGKKFVVRGNGAMRMEESVARPSWDEDLQQAAAPVQPGQRLHLKILEPHGERPEDGIARIEGFIIDVAQAAKKAGQEVEAEIEQVFRTYAKAVLLG
ncbi:MAG: Rne/Rng family ribonuclease [Clostridiales bacterium]|nr:Rne/Rng family ribonuclease [Clostridiales bacterium]